MELHLVVVVKIASLAKLALQFPILIHLCLNSLFDLLLSVNKVQVAFLELAKDFVHLVRVIEEEVLFPQMLWEVD